MKCPCFVRCAPAVCGRRASLLFYRLDGVSGAAPLRFCRLRGPRRVRGAALRPGGLMLSCAGARTLKRLSQVGRSHNAARLVGKNRLSEGKFWRMAASGVSRDGWRALGGLPRAVCEPGELPLPSETEAAPASRDRRGAPRAAPRRRSSRRSSASPGRHAAER